MCYLSALKHNMKIVWEAYYLLPPVIKETRFISLNNDNIKQVPPVFSYNEVHSSIPAANKDSAFYFVSNALELVMRVQ